MLETRVSFDRICKYFNRLLIESEKKSSRIILKPASERKTESKHAGSAGFGVD